MTNYQRYFFHFVSQRDNKDTSNHKEHCYVLESHQENKTKFSPLFVIYSSTSNGIVKPKLSKYSQILLSIFLQQTRWVPGTTESSRLIIPHYSFSYVSWELSLEETPLKFFKLQSNKSWLDKGLPSAKPINPICFFTKGRRKLECFGRVCSVLIKNTRPFLLLFLAAPPAVFGT